MRFFFKRVLHPAWHAIKRDGVNRAMRELEGNQWLSTVELLELQNRKLGELIRHAGQHVPYYRALFQKVGFEPGSVSLTGRFSQVPILTKDIIRSDAKALVSEELGSNRLIANSTSGSTGRPIKFYTDTRSTAYRSAAEMRSNAFTGWQLGDRWMTLWGAPMDIPAGKAFRSFLRRMANRRVFLSSFDLSSGRLDDYVKRIQDFRPVLLVGYPGPLEQLALHCRRNATRFPSLQAVVSSAETLWPPQREVIEATLKVKVFDRYGSREVGQVGSECGFHNGMHISVDRVVIEVVDDNGDACRPGETGRILVTDLDNFGMPLIRYDIGDRAVVANGGDCECGRGLPKIDRIEGRSLEIIHTPDGRRVGGTFWTLLLRSRPGFQQFQVVQGEIDGVVINFVRDKDEGRPEFEYFTDKIKEKCGADFKIAFVEKDTIELTGAGKQKLIVSEIANPASAAHERRAPSNFET